jgi:hypothetical protein
VDWRGWVALAWAAFWGWAYALMLLQARAPQVLRGIKALAGIAVAAGRTVDPR